MQIIKLPGPIVQEARKNIEMYKGLYSNLDTAISYLASHDLTELPAGRTEVDGDQVYINFFRLFRRVDFSFCNYRNGKRFRKRREATGKQLISLLLKSKRNTLILHLWRISLH